MMMDSGMMRSMTRRQFFQTAGWGVGGMALHSLLARDGMAEANTPAGSHLPQGLHFPARAKNVIYIHLVGAPSHLDLFDPSRSLQKRSGELCPDAFFVGKQAGVYPAAAVAFGDAEEEAVRLQEVRCSRGSEISNLMPHLQGVADELCFIRTLHTDQFNHAPAQMFMP